MSFVPYTYISNVLYMRLAHSFIRVLLLMAFFSDSEPNLFKKNWVKWMNTNPNTLMVFCASCCQQPFWSHCCKWHSALAYGSSQAALVVPGSCMATKLVQGRGKNKDISGRGGWRTGSSSREGGSGSWQHSKSYFEMSTVSTPFLLEYNIAYFHHPKSSNFAISQNKHTGGCLHFDELTVYILNSVLFKN